jgi:glycine hydroxymethyltransferase
VTSGIRVGSAAGTTRGLDADEFYQVGSCIARAVFARGDEAALDGIKAEIDAILAAHPLYPEYLGARY